MGRLLVVSNRLPVTLRIGEQGPELQPSAGGLATGLRAPHEQAEGRWIGWPGPLGDLDTGQRERALGELAERRLVPVELSAEEIARYYEGYANGVLWPLFHYMPWQLPLEVAEFPVYEAVNERFADAVAAEWTPGDTIWVHDYQLLLVPGMLRERLPDARIGFFLHIPFPSSEIFRCLPERERILRGMLGADLIGFHTAAYARHFGSSVLRILGVAPRVDRVRFRGRDVRIGVFPMGVDAEGFAAFASQPDVEAMARELRGDPSTRLLVGIDRLDYTKGIERRLLAYERMLLRHPELLGHVRFVQVAVPSREDVGAYQEFRGRAEALIGRIHGEFATPSWVPVHWIYRGLSREEVVALYRAADVMVVTPLRDGMNLVAKEFAASRVDEDGVLVLSEFAGVASELAEVVSVNPYDVDVVAEAYHRALTIPLEERRERMRALRRRVFSYDVHRWVREFLAALDDAAASAVTAPLRMTPAPEVAALAARLRSEPLLLLLDYDGTLVPFAGSPRLATPDAELHGLLAELAARPNTEVHVVSGRAPDVLERWLGDLPIALHAEHGLWSRGSPGEKWRARSAPSTQWRESVARILEDFAARTPGTLVEEKTASLAWHYRAADPDFGARQAKELQIHLSEVLSNLPVEILPGNMVIEIRPHGVHKGRIAEEVTPWVRPGLRIVAIGDDLTDEDLFAALPEDAETIHVGPAPSVARWRLLDVASARRFLRALLPGAGPPA
ncbi:MAG: bifunctional alpha,alpha-trehalose-phosphate synthase (UDP-forming)/trehalose-phosphatase [Proteobacteria bacterium]|nr:MAG: bifunctional alpha,alpha-trehalose-phosphate synthase (UDP-forming)/trehalose-phosphatase [Pseudomonadota bacterium]